MMHVGVLVALSCLVIAMASTQYSDVEASVEAKKLFSHLSQTHLHDRIHRARP
jgi:hypothetical protein